MTAETAQPAKRKSLSKSKGNLPDAAQEPAAAAPLPPMPELMAVTEAVIQSIPKEEMLPLFFTTTSQDMFGVKGGVDVTEEHPIKMIPKADILADMFTRAAVSDWAPAKQLIQNFPREEIMLYYDPEFKYGQNFFICTTVTAMDTVLQAALRVQSHAEGEGEAQPGAEGEQLTGGRPGPRPAHWQCLGSDADMETERMRNSRELIEYLIYKKRSYFGAPCSFADKNAEDTYQEYRPFKDINYEVTRLEIPREVQAVPVLAQQAVQTTWNRPVNFAAQYENLDMPEEVKQSLLNSKEIICLLRESTPKIQKALQLTSMLDIFQDDYLDLGDEDFAVVEGAVVHLAEYQSFADLKRTKDRSVSCIEWHPSAKGVVAISCSRRVSLDDRIDVGFSYKHRQSFIIFWSFSDPIHPQLVLEAPDDVCCFQFNKEYHNIVVAGCANGQLVLWDISEHQERLRSTKGKGAAGVEGGGKAVETPTLRYLVLSSIELGHRSACTDIQWLPKHLELSHAGELMENGNNGGNQLVTTSLDGTVSFWDLRYKKELTALDLVWRPFYRMPLSVADVSFEYGLVKIAIRRDAPERKAIAAAKPTSASGANPDDVAVSKPAAKADKAEHPPLTSFYCASEEGELLLSHMAGNEKLHEEKGGSRVSHTYVGHFGPMSDVQRSPFFPDILLSVGGWSFAIWKEGMHAGPLLSSAFSPTYVISGRWSPTRPGVFYITKSDGSLEIWDLLDFSHIPTAVQNISSSPLSYLEPYQAPGKNGSQFLAVGDDEGTLHILEVPKNLRRASKNELQVVRAYFDREVKRLQYAQKRKQQRAAERKKPADANPEPEEAQKPAELPDHKALGEALENEYKRMEKAFLEEAGLLAPAEAA